jgi:hypothetical protein
MSRKTIGTVNPEEIGIHPTNLAEFRKDAAKLFVLAPNLLGVALYGTADDYNDETYEKTEGEIFYAIAGQGFSHENGLALAAANPAVGQALYLSEPNWIETAAGLIDLEGQYGGEDDDEIQGARFIFVTRDGTAFFTAQPDVLFYENDNVPDVRAHDWSFLYVIGEASEHDAATIAGALPALAAKINLGR